MPNVNIVRTALATIARVSSDMASSFLKFSFACYRPFSSLFFSLSLSLNAYTFLICFAIEARCIYQ